MTHRPVPENVIEASRLFEGVHCNLRPNQRPPKILYKEFAHLDSDDIFGPFCGFLVGLTNVNNRIAVLFQDFDGKGMESAVFDLGGISWFGGDGPPRIDYGGPNELVKEAMMGLQNLSGAYVLAMAIVPSDTPDDDDFDSDAEKFLDVIRTKCKPKDRLRILSVDSLLDEFENAVAAALPELKAGSIGRNAIHSGFVRLELKRRLSP